MKPPEPFCSNPALAELTDMLLAHFSIITHQAFYSHHIGQPALSQKLEDLLE